MSNNMDLFSRFGPIQMKEKLHDLLYVFFFTVLPISRRMRESSANQIILQCLIPLIVCIACQAIESRMIRANTMDEQDFPSSLTILRWLLQYIMRPTEELPTRDPWRFSCARCAFNHCFQSFNCNCEMAQKQSSAGICWLVIVMLLGDSSEVTLRNYHFEIWYIGSYFVR